MRYALYRKRTGGIVADWRYTHWLRLWLDEEEMWRLLENLSPERLGRFERILRRCIYNR